MPQNVNIKATMHIDSSGAQTIGGAAPQTGFTVTPGTGDILRIANAAGASGNYIIEIVGF